MTGLTKRLLPLQRSADAEGSEPPEEVAAGPLVEVALPDTERSVREGLADAVRPLVAGVASDLGLPPPREVVATEIAGPLGRLSIDGRPAATFDVSSLQGGTEAGQRLAGEIVHQVLDRLPLLLGEGGLRSNAAYLVDLGLRVSAVQQHQPLSVSLGEELVAKAVKLPTVVFASEETLRNAGPGARDAMRNARDRGFHDRGVALPDVKLRPTELADGLVQLNLNDVHLPARALGDGAGWADVVRYFADTAGRHRHWFVWPEQVSRRIANDIRYLYPDLVEIVEASFSTATVTACIRELVRSGASVRNVPRIMWLMLEQEPSRAAPDVLRLAESPLVPKRRPDDAVERDPVVLAARIRKLAAEEAWRLGSFIPPAGPARIPLELEDELLTASGVVNAAAAEWALVDGILGEPGVRTIVTHRMEAISPVQAVVHALPARPRVICSHELPPDYDLASVPTIAGAPTGVRYG